MDMKDLKSDTTYWQSGISRIVPVFFLGNGICGCNGYCTCNEGFSGDICECGPRATDECSNPVGGKVSSPCVSMLLWSIMSREANKLNYRTLIC